MRQIAVVLLFGVGCATTEAPKECVVAAPTSQPEYRPIAEKIVTQLAMVKADDNVLISGDPRFAPLLEELWIATAKQGGQAIVQLYSSNMTKRYFDEVPQQYDAAEPTLELNLAKAIDVEIALDASDPSVIKEIPAERLATVQKATQPVGKTKLERAVRIVDVGNGLFPTAALAKQLGVSVDDLSKAFWDGVNVDYGQLTRRGEKIKGLLSTGKQVRITHPNGTDLSLRIEGREPIVSDGIISDEDIAKGGAGSITFLPAGEVYTTPIPGSAEGKVVIDRFPYAGGQVKNLTFVFEKGKVTSVTADPCPSWERWKAQYDAAPEGKEDLAWIDIGLNPAVTAPGLQNFVMSGMVTVGIGGNLWAGGENATPFGAYGYLSGATLEVDGQPVVHAGELKIDPGT